MLIMMTLHFIFVPILSIVALYYFLKLSKEEAKKVRDEEAPPIGAEPLGLVAISRRDISISGSLAES